MNYPRTVTNPLLKKHQEVQPTAPETSEGPPSKSKNLLILLNMLLTVLLMLLYSQVFES